MNEGRGIGGKNTAAQQRFQKLSLRVRSPSDFSTHTRCLDGAAGLLMWQAGPLVHTYTCCLAALPSPLLTPKGRAVSPDRHLQCDHLLWPQLMTDGVEV